MPTSGYWSYVELYVSEWPPVEAYLAGQAMIKAIENWINTWNAEFGYMDR